MIAALIIVLPEHKLSALVFRALLVNGGTCDALSEHTDKEIGSGNVNGSSGSDDSQQRDARTIEQPEVHLNVILYGPSSLQQRQLDLWLLPYRGGEAHLRYVVSRTVQGYIGLSDRRWVDRRP